MGSEGDAVPQLSLPPTRTRPPLRHSYVSRLNRRTDTRQQTAAGPVQHCWRDALEPLKGFGCVGHWVSTENGALEPCLCATHPSSPSPAQTLLQPRHSPPVICFVSGYSSRASSEAVPGKSNLQCISSGISGTALCPRWDVGFPVPPAEPCLVA